jgi:hypothetical protein
LVLSQQSTNSEETQAAPWREEKRVHEDEECKESNATDPPEEKELTIAEIRRILSVIRRRWDGLVDNSRDMTTLTADLNINNRLLGVERFALRFILGQHHIRRE